MIPPKPFRFGIQGRTTGPRDEWLEMVRRVEALGYSTFLALDHFVRGLDPVASLMAAAMATTTLRVGGFVFDNDFRHPAVLAKAAATIDVLSGGRFELGIGAGWLKEEYDQTGIAFDPAPVRIERLTEAVHLIKRIFTEEPPVSFAGTHYTVTDLVCPPRPVQRPHPPFMIGGGGPRLLAVAAREADIVGINGNMHAGVVGPDAIASMTAESVDEKLAIVQAAAGDRAKDVEMNVRVFMVNVTEDRDASVDFLAKAMSVEQKMVEETPFALIGPPSKLIEDLLERRERWGFSYIIVGGDDIESFAPVVDELVGR